jgi:ADP-ribose pyrophosphatase YjhB (NUDIX family)
MGQDQGRQIGRNTKAWAPDDAFAIMLRYGVIPTFDLILHGPRGVLMVRRRISPYEGAWALPGLRILKGETIEDCLRRIAEDEVGIKIEPAAARFVSQTVVRFPSDHNRQDLSNCYAVEIGTEKVSINKEYLSAWSFAKDLDSMPTPLGDLYRHHLSCYFAGIEDTKVSVKEIR